VFEPNVHSKWQVGWKAVSPQCFGEVCTVLGEGYSTYEVQSVMQIDEWEHASNNYRVQYGMDGLTHEVLLRRHILQDSGSIRASTTLIRHLRHHRIPCPAVLLADGGLRFVEHGGYNWQMFEFVHGDHFRGEESELTQAATLIAKMHHVFDTISPQRWNIVGINEAIGPLDQACWGAIHELGGVNDFERFVIVQRAFIHEYVGRASDALRRVAFKEDLIHGDLHPQNFLFPECSPCVILDFGNACFADYRYDIAMALHRLVRQYIVHQARPWRDSILAGVATFLGAYRTINPSVEQDVRLLPKFMSAMLFRKMAHNLGLYRKGARSWESCLSQWQRFFGFLDEVDAFQTVMS